MVGIMAKGLRASAAVVAALVAVLISAVATETKAQNLSAVPVNSGAMARAISGYRLSHGRPPVVVSPQLNALALNQSMAMARIDQLSHSVAGPLGTRLRAGGYIWRAAAENVAAGQTSAEAALAAWQASSGHRQNLLRSSVTQIGIAAVRNGNSRYGVYWTLILARPR